MSLNKTNNDKDKCASKQGPTRIEETARMLKRIEKTNKKEKTVLNVEGRPKSQYLYATVADFPNSEEAKRVL
jgi:hypothetical protein